MKRFNGQIRPLMVRSSHLTDAQVRAKKNSDQSTGIMRISGWKIFLWSRQGVLARLGVAYRCSFAQSPCALRAVWMHLTALVFAACIHFTPTRVLAGESAYAASVEVWSAITATSMNAGGGDCGLTGSSGPSGYSLLESAGRLSVCQATAALSRSRRCLPARCWQPRPRTAGWRRSFQPGLRRSG